MKGQPLLLLGIVLVASACSGDETIVADPAGTTAVTSATSATSTSVSGETATAGEESTFTAEVWADNWFALYVNGALVGEDSVPITTERSFNAETFTFDATYPMTIAIEAKDFKETDSGLEYIGEQNQQMGDGGLIAQIRDGSSQVVAVTDSTWVSLVVHQAPLNPECEMDADPNTSCRFQILEHPTNWIASDFDAGAWASATEWTEADVGPKDGYNDITWDAAARLIWASDLEIDNTVLLRLTVSR